MDPDLSRLLARHGLIVGGTYFNVMNLQSRTAARENVERPGNIFSNIASRMRRVFRCVCCRRRVPSRNCMSESKRRRIYNIMHLRYERMVLNAEYDSILESCDVEERKEFFENLKRRDILHIHVERAQQHVFDTMLNTMYAEEKEDIILIGKLAITRLIYKRHGHHLFRRTCCEKLCYFLRQYNMAMISLPPRWKTNPLLHVMKGPYSPIHESFRLGHEHRLEVFLNYGFKVEYSDEQRYKYAMSCGRNNDKENVKDRLSYLYDRSLQNKFEEMLEYKDLDGLMKYTRYDEGPAYDSQENMDENSSFLFNDQKRKLEALEEVLLRPASVDLVMSFDQLPLGGLAGLYNCVWDKEIKRIKPPNVEQWRQLLIFQILFAFMKPKDSEIRAKMVQCLYLVWRSIPDTYILPSEIHLILDDFTLKDAVTNACEEYANSGILGSDNINKPRLLKHYCRCRIRESLIQNFQLNEGVNSLSIPPQLKSYIMLKW